MAASKHIVLHSLNAWGHLKPAIGIAARIVEAQPDVIFTVLTSSMYYTKSVNEVARISKHADRFHVIDIQGVPRDVFAQIVEFGPAFEALWRSEGVTCKSSGRTVSGLPRPTMAFLELFSYNAAEAVRAIAGDQCTVTVFLVACANTLLRVMAPEELGGLGDIRSKLQARVAAGEDIVEAAHKVWKRTKGEVVHTPGLPPVFDYEWFPQEDNIPHALLTQDANRFMLLADVALLPTSDILEKESIDALRGWYESIGKTLWTVGPPNPPEDKATSDKVLLKPEDEKVLAFLDRVHKTHGNNSIIYVSFGSHFWPSDSSRLWAVIDELLESKTPFVFAQASPNAVMPPEHAAAIEASEISLAVPWVPQDALLAHPAVGWFITHGGWNSTQEGLLAKVPLIFYPIAADQPGNALLMSVKRQAAFELLSVRTGLGQQIPYRCRDGPVPDFSAEGVKKETRTLLERLKGEDGRRVRANFERLGEAYGKTWTEGGEAKANLEGFMRKYIG